MRGLEGVGSVGGGPGLAATDELSRVLGLRVVSREPMVYRSTFPLEELTVRLAGQERKLIFKDLSANDAGDSGWAVRAPFLHDPLREIETYREVLAPNGVSSPTLHLAVVEPRLDRYWLFLERVEGDLLWQVGDLKVWQRAARWLARHHSRFSDMTPQLPRRLLVHDTDYYRRWLERAGRFVAWRQGAPEDLGHFDQIIHCYRRSVDWLERQLPTLLHGEFYPSNVLVERGERGPRIRPVDWEMAGVGPGLLDLAALASGVWSQAEREALAFAYHEALPGRLRPTREELLRGLARCRFLVALQWLGWSRDWRPPAEHTHDWLSTALELAREEGA